jgi:hypothetical protein
MTKRKWTGSRSGKPIERPVGEVRHSQLVTTFGPGAMVDLLGDAVIVGGLDHWTRGRAVDEPRLRDMVDLKLRANGGRGLSLEHPFFSPPQTEDEPTRKVGIKVLEFPRWFVCPECRALIASALLDPSGDERSHKCDNGKSHALVPVRFVGACRRGHVQDFPWRWFIHLGGKNAECTSGRFRLEEGASGDFAEVIVSCSCGEKKSLSAALNKDLAPGCGGERPWLNSTREDCDEKLKLLVRTASNSYFSVTASSLWIPESGRELENALKQSDVWGTMQIADASNIATFRQIPAILRALARWTDAEVLTAADALKRGETVPRKPIRVAEFELLKEARDERPGEMPSAADKFFVRQIPRPKALPKVVSEVAVVPALCDVVAQVGFTRLEPLTVSLDGELDLDVRVASLSVNQDWIPAVEQRGEGIFLRFDEKALQKWEARPEVVARDAELGGGHTRWTDSLVGNKPDFFGARYYMLHSLSHLLMHALSLECGYAASALREHIYCGTEASGYAMAGILLCTTSPGSEGTLGGLVAQGRRIEKHLERALRLGSLCSNDPICASHSPKDDPSERWLEGAACHGCLFVAECSCERFNRHLDRALVVPTIGNPAALAFFDEPGT